MATQGERLDELAGKVDQELDAFGAKLEELEKTVKVLGDVAAIRDERDADRARDIENVAAFAGRLREEMRGPRGIHGKMAEIQGLVEDIEARGHADVTTKGGGSYSYDYILEADLMAAVRPLLAERGVAVYYRDRVIEGPPAVPLTRVEVELELVDSESGEGVVLTGEGTAYDSGDKAANKAKTMAVRYLLWKTFLVPSDIDPEQDSGAPPEPAPAPRAARGRGTGQPTRGRVVERINRLAVELDELDGLEPGASIRGIREQAKSREHYGRDLTDVSDDTLVEIAATLAGHVTSKRDAKEKGELEGHAAYSLPAPKNDDDIPF